MKKNVGLTYGDFEFPAEQGFTGSRAKGYKRGGAVKKMPCGGEVKANMGGFMGPEREIQVDDVTITTPRAKGGRVGLHKSASRRAVGTTRSAKGGYMEGGMHGKLKKAGAKMGYKYGGQVKKYGASGDTSDEFKMKTGKQKTMDHGNQPARRGRNQAEIEAGGTKRLKPGLHKGGRVDSGGGALADAAIKHAKKVLHGKHKLKAPLKASAAGMPKNVKSHGGTVNKARGGSVKK